MRLKIRCERIVEVTVRGSDVEVEMEISGKQLLECNELYELVEKEELGRYYYDDGERAQSYERAQEREEE